MAEGLALHIGVNHVNPEQYEGWAGKLRACEADAEAMARLCRAGGFTSQLFLTGAATREAILAETVKAQQRLRAGDVFLISFAGNGSLVADKNGDEESKRDETWCLYDGQLVDDELWALWAGFARAVKIVVVTDCSYAGTVSRAPLSQDELDRVRMAPIGVSKRTYQAHQQFYDRLQKSRPFERIMKQGGGAATVIEFAACQDNQTARESSAAGVFTAALVKSLDGGPVRRTYAMLHRTTVSQMPASQTPTLSTAGARIPGVLDQPAFVR
jgi:metacaspase-1